MIKTNKVIVSVGIIIILILSVINTTSLTTTPTSDPLTLNPYPLEVEKKVRYGFSGWVDEIEVPIGTIVRFNISVIYHDIDYNDSCRILSKINITDYLENFEYNGNVSCSWLAINPDNYLKYYNSTNTYIWTFNNDLILSETSHSYISVFYLEFDARINSSGSFRNYVEVNGTESCCGRHVHNDADAFVNVNEPQNPAIDITKYVGENSNWGKNASVNICDTVYFKLLIHNTGNVALTNVNITDTLPSFLSFNNDATIIPSSFSVHYISWSIKTLAVDQTIIILFSANATESGKADNYVIVTTDEGLSDNDTAYIVVLNQGTIQCTKTVWDSDIQDWINEINAVIGDTVRFNITFMYFGSGNLSNIKIVDLLPTNIEYANNSTLSMTGKNNNILFWNLSNILNDRQSMSIEFDGCVIHSGTTINIVNITAIENCCTTLYCDDTVTVIVKEPSSNLKCEKKIWDTDTDQWVEQIDVDVGETIRFNITLIYIGESTLIDIHVIDLLPAGLQYGYNASRVESGINDSVIFWNLSDVLQDDQRISIEFDVLAISSGTYVNSINITGYEHCIEPLYCKDTATVIIAEPPIPGSLECEKKIWDPNSGQWVEQINVDVGDTVRFNISLTYNGSGSFSDIHIIDLLPAGLQYGYNASRVESGINDSVIFWNLSDVLQDDQRISIEFDVLVNSSGTLVNSINITGYERFVYLLICEDSAIVVAELPPPTLQCEKKVWDSSTQQWVEVINAVVGDTVRFRINVTYWGSLAFYDMIISDTLPICLQYANNATPYQPTINGKEVIWNPVLFLHYGQKITFEFDALVISYGENINTVNITGIECGIRHLSCEDTATVLVEKQPEPLLVDIKGPYEGYVNESIQITGSAIGGVAPYTYLWDIDNDGVYDDGSDMNTTTYTWNKSGIYIIYLKVVDSRGINNTDSSDVTINIRNSAPNIPSIPEGPDSGKTKKEYTFSSTVIDPNGDLIYLVFDWDDGNTSGWLGPYNSGVSCEVTHSWSLKGSYNIKVKAKDIHGFESAWSDPLIISLRRSLDVQYGSIFENLIDRFPALEHLLTVLLNILETIQRNHLSIR